MVARKRARGGTQLTCAGSDAIPHTAKAAEAWLAQHIAPPAVLASVLNSFRFLVMADKERRALLAGALASDPVPLEPWAITACAPFQLPMPQIGCVQNAAQVAALYKGAFEMRTQVNRDLKNLGPMVAPASPYPGYALEEVAAQVQELATAANKITSQRARASVDWHRRKGELDVARTEKAALEPHVLETADLDRLQAIVKTEAKRKALATKAVEAARTMSTAEYRRADAKRALDVAEASNSNGRCPACQQEIAGAAKLREQTIDAAREALVEAERVLVNASRKAEELQKDLELMPDVEAAKRQIERHQASFGAWQRADKVLREAGELGPEPLPQEATPEEAELDGRIAKGRVIEGELRAYQGALAEFQKLEARAKRLVDHAAALDRLVAYFSDAGPLKAALVEGRLPAFLLRIQSVLERFGFEAGVGDGFDITVRAESGHPLGLHQLSESQAFRFSIAFQIALAEATGVGLVVIDRADVLLPGVRSMLTDELLDSRLDQAFVLAASEDPALPEEFPEGVAFYNLAQDSHGVTTVLAAGGKAEVSYAAAE